MLILFTSAVLLIQASIHASKMPGEASLAYAIAVSVISLVFTVLFIAFARFKTNAFMTKTLKVRQHSFTVPQLYGLFIALWWGIGTFVLTFYKPYSVPSNAYVACWLSFFSAALYMASVFSRVETAFRSFSEVSLAPSLTALGGTMIAAAVIFFVSLGYLNFWAGGPRRAPLASTMCFVQLRCWSTT